MPSPGDAFVIAVTLFEPSPPSFPHFLIVPPPQHFGYPQTLLQAGQQPTYTDGSL